MGEAPDGPTSPPSVDLAIALKNFRDTTGIEVQLDSDLGTVHICRFSQFQNLRPNLRGD